MKKNIQIIYSRIYLTEVLSNKGGKINHFKTKKIIIDIKSLCYFDYNVNISHFYLNIKYLSKRKALIIYYNSLYS